MDYRLVNIISSYFVRIHMNGVNNFQLFFFVEPKCIQTQRDVKKEAIYHLDQCNKQLLKLMKNIPEGKVWKCCAYNQKAVQNCLTLMNQVSILMGRAPDVSEPASLPASDSQVSRSSGRKRTAPPTLTEAELAEPEKKKDTAPKQFQCYCGVQNDDKEDFDKHVQIHVGVPFKCATCDQPYKNGYTCWIHVRTKHNGKYTYYCKDCGDGFEQHIKLCYHRHNAHNDPSPYKCPSCHKVFGQVCTMKKHVCSTNKQLQYKCVTCSLSAKSKDTLAAHVWFKHLDGDDLTCEYDGCEKFYKTAGSFRNHLGEENNLHAIEANKVKVHRFEAYLRDAKKHMPDIYNINDPTLPDKFRPKRGGNGNGGQDGGNDGGNDGENGGAPLVALNLDGDPDLTDQ